MNTEFRTKLRVKRWKYPDILKKLAEMQSGPLYPMPQPVYPWPATSKCARCGMDWSKGAMAYCCPHGNICGVPMMASPNGWPPPALFDPNVCQSSMIGTKADVWN